MPQPFKGILTVGAVLIGMAFAHGVAFASGQDNAIQPSPLHFGTIQQGEHPHKDVRVTNKTGRNQYLRSIGLSGAGGRKFAISHVNDPGHCVVGMNLRNGESCLLTIHVTATLPEWYESHILINYGPRLHSRPLRGNWNGAVFAHIV